MNPDNCSERLWLIVPIVRKQVVYIYPGFEHLQGASLLHGIYVREGVSVSRRTNCRSRPKGM